MRACPVVQTDARQLALAPDAPSCRCIRRRHWLAAALDRSKRSPGDLYRKVSPPVREWRVQISGDRSSPNLTAGMSVNNITPRFQRIEKNNPGFARAFRGQRVVAMQRALEVSVNSVKAISAQPVSDAQF